MDGLKTLGAAIDDLFIQKRSGRRLNRQLVFIVGDGIHPVNNILNDKLLRKEAKAKGIKFTTQKAFEAYKWRHFEYARYYTTTSRPSFAHCCIYKLAEAGLCRDIITTNYDMYFDTMWQHAPDLRVCMNPVLGDEEYSWENYYAPTDDVGDRTRYWKIHGSLSHVSFRSKRTKNINHLHRLPGFAISANDDNLAESFRIPTQAPHMGFEAAHYPRTQFESVRNLTPGFLPFIDWTYKNNRRYFQREIESAKAIIRDAKRIAALVIIGFSGYYNEHKPNDPKNEELVPEIRGLLARGFRNIYMAVPKYQARRISRSGYSLMRLLQGQKHCWPYQSASHFMRALLKGYSRKFPYDFANAEHEKWKRWYLQQKEASHA